MAEFRPTSALEDPVPNLMPGMAAHDLRAAILTRLESYRELQASSAHIRPPPSDPGNPHTSKLEMSQAALLRHIRLLTSLTAQLEKKLDDKRWMKWFLGPVLALLGRIFYLSLYKLPYFRSWSPFRLRNAKGEPRPAILEILALSPWFTWPLGAWNIYQFEKKVRRTARLRQNLGEMEFEVERAYPVQQSSECLQSTRWDSIPWEEKSGFRWSWWG
ncbi:unnamed protein product [Clonostachys rhizophaga]|uniref:Uncharacterized protein n=1 Tax=Clonostachys rhizophaga TaxID=160324 RepID=A0A9N9YIK2_9HYPO|nr:unnamed protein product [Clonostachys rhizophaga]